MDSPKVGRRPRSRTDEVALLRHRLEEQKQVIASLERRVAQLEEARRKLDEACSGLDDIRVTYACPEPTKVSDLIGCLEDCVRDPEELRRRSRDVRNQDRR